MGRGVPIFAICYGAQLVAHALGGTVSRSTHPEIGWHAVSSTSHPELFSHTWLQWHYDVFTVPENFRTIASNDIGPQAMIGKRVLATQFHPEATLGIISRWSSGAGMAELHTFGLDPRYLIEDSARRLGETTLLTAQLVDWFLATTNS